MKLFDQALVEITKAVEISPLNVDLRRWRAECFSHRGDWSMALNDIK